MGMKHISPLFLSSWKRRILDIFFLYSYHIYFQSHFGSFCRRFWRIFNFYSNNGPLPNVIISALYFKYCLLNWRLNWWKWQNDFIIVGSTEQICKTTRVKWNKKHIKNYPYQKTFLLMIYVEKTSYFDVAPPGHSIAYKNIEW